VVDPQSEAAEPYTAAQGIIGLIQHLCISS
jgi:hypothetical protein